MSLFETERSSARFETVKLLAPPPLPVLPELTEMALPKSMLFDHT